MRRLWVQVHLWLGLTLGVVGALLGLSGCLLVYDYALEALLYPHRYAISGTQAALSAAEYIRIAEAAHPDGARTLALRLPDRNAIPITAFVRVRDDPGPLQRVYLDPPTGRVLAREAGPDLVTFLRLFHESLALREHRGRQIVGAVGIAMLVSSVIGLYLWWPRGGLRRDAFGFRRSFALHRNLHYTIGIWGAAVLLVLAFTGILLAYPDAARAAISAAAAVSAAPRGIQGTESQEAPIGPDEAVAIARHPYPEATVIGLGLPVGPRGVYRVNLREAGDTNSRSDTVLLIDPRVRTVLQRTDRATRRSGDTFLLWQRILHEGGAFGAVGRFVTFLGGLMPAILLVTGFLMWLRTRRRRRASASTGATAA